MPILSYDCVSLQGRISKVDFLFERGRGAFQARRCFNEGRSDALLGRALRLSGRRFGGPVGQRKELLRGVAAAALRLPGPDERSFSRHLQSMVNSAGASGTL